MQFNAINWSPAAGNGDFRAMVAEALAASDSELKDSLAATHVQAPVINADLGAAERDAAIRERMQRALAGTIDCRLYPANYAGYGFDDFIEAFGSPGDLEPLPGGKNAYGKVRVTAVELKISAAALVLRQAVPSLTAAESFALLKGRMPAVVTKEALPLDDARRIAAALDRSGTMSADVVPEN